MVDTVTVEECELYTNRMAPRGAVASGPVIVNGPAPVSLTNAPNDQLMLDDVVCCVNIKPPPVPLPTVSDVPSVIRDRLLTDGTTDKYVVGVVSCT